MRVRAFVCDAGGGGEGKMQTDSESLVCDAVVVLGTVLVLSPVLNSEHETIMPSCAGKGINKVLL